jgi:uncharacterized membrane protein YagU involved in acid resistance
MERRRPVGYDATAAAGAGLLAGLISGAVLSVLMVIQQLATGVSPWAGLRMIAATVIGAKAMGTGFALWPVLVGTAVHFALSAAFGLGFGLVAYRWDRATVLWSSVVWGLLVYSFMVFIALPVVNPEMVPAEISFIAALQHVLFGFVIGLGFEALRFRLGERQVLPAERMVRPPTTTTSPTTPQPV